VNKHVQRYTPTSKDRQIAGSMCSSYSLPAMRVSDMLLLRAAWVYHHIHTYGYRSGWEEVERVLTGAGFPPFKWAANDSLFDDPDRRIPELLRQAVLIDGYVRSQFVNHRTGEGAYAMLLDAADGRSPVFYRWLDLTLDVGERDPARLLQGYRGETDADVFHRFIDSQCYRRGTAIVTGRADVVETERLIDVWMWWCARQNLLSDRVTVQSLLQAAGFTLATSGEGRASITTVKRLSLRPVDKRHDLL
jgi:hypothetical protein